MARQQEENTSFGTPLEPLVPSSRPRPTLSFEVGHWEKKSRNAVGVGGVGILFWMMLDDVVLWTIAKSLAWLLILDSRFIHFIQILLALAYIGICWHCHRNSDNSDKCEYDTGWWFGTFFPYIGNFIIPTDFHIFQRGRSTTTRICLHMPALYWKCQTSSSPWDWHQLYKV